MRLYVGTPAACQELPKAADQFPPVPQAAEELATTERQLLRIQGRGAICAERGVHSGEVDPTVRHIQGVAVAGINGDRQAAQASRRAEAPDGGAGTAMTAAEGVLRVAGDQVHSVIASGVGDPKFSAPARHGHLASDSHMSIVCARTRSSASPELSCRTLGSTCTRPKSRRGDQRACQCPPHSVMCGSTDRHTLTSVAGRAPCFPPRRAGRPLRRLTHQGLQAAPSPHASSPSSLPKAEPSSSVGARGDGGSASPLSCPPPVRRLTQSNTPAAPSGSLRLCGRASGLYEWLGRKTASGLPVCRTASTVLSPGSRAEPASR